MTKSQFRVPQYSDHKLAFMSGDIVILSPPLS